MNLDNMHTIMLAEDDLMLTNLLKTFLEIEGFKVTIFGGQTEDELINSCAQQRPDILLMDVNLHQINGLHALQNIRKMAPLKDLPVVMTSGSDLRDQCDLAGANAFVMKPYNPDELIKMINIQFTTQ